MSPLPIFEHPKLSQKSYYEEVLPGAERELYNVRYVSLLTTTQSPVEQEWNKTGLTF